MKPKFNKLNIGCGNDYREDFVNIDVDFNLPKVDIVMDIKPGILLAHFEQGSFSYILAQHFLEHFFHWESHLLLKDFYRLLTKGGLLNLSMPNAENIIKDDTKEISEKLLWLYGGQDIQSSKGPDTHRQNFPQYYCHKFGWTLDSIEAELTSIGFINVKLVDNHWSMDIISGKR